MGKLVVQSKMLIFVLKFLQVTTRLLLSSCQTTYVKFPFKITYAHVYVYVYIYIYIYIYIYTYIDVHILLNKIKLFREFHMCACMLALFLMPKYMFWF